MKSKLTLAFLMCAATAVLLAQTQPAPSASLLVLAKSDQTMSVVDPVTLKVLGRVPSGPDPHEIVASTDGRVCGRGPGGACPIADLLLTSAEDGPASNVSYRLTLERDELFLIGRRAEQLEQALRRLGRVSENRASR